MNMQISQPKKMYRKGSKVYLMDVQPDELYSDVNADDVVNYSGVAGQIEGEADPAKQLKLLKYYSSLWRLTPEQSDALAKAAGIKFIDKDSLTAFTKNVCERLFTKFVRRYNSIIDLTSDNWQDFKNEELRKVVKNGTQTISAPQLENLVINFKSDNVREIDTLQFTDSNYSGADVKKLLFKKYHDAIKPIIDFMDKELNKCLKKYLKEQGETELNAYTQQDGRRRHGTRRHHRRHSDGKRLRRSVRRSVRHDGGHKKSKGKSSRRKSVRFDGGALKKWLQKIRRSRK